MKWNREEKQKKLKKMQNPPIAMSRLHNLFIQVFGGVGVGWNKKHTLSLRHYTLWDHFRALRKAKKNIYIFICIFTYIHIYTHM